MRNDGGSIQGEGKLVQEADSNGACQRLRETACDVTLGLGAFAVTIISPMGSMPLAVGVGGPLPRIAHRIEAIISALKEFQAAFASGSADQD